MSKYDAGRLTMLGVAAAKARDYDKAREILSAAIDANTKDVAAWWWRAQVERNPKTRAKAFEHARAIAAENQEALLVYRRQLEETGHEKVHRMRLAAGSQSVGDMCPICTSNLSASDTVVSCPECHRGNHVQCWEENVFHCGNYACDGEGIVDMTAEPLVEADLTRETVSLAENEIPEEAQQPTREQQEAGFMSNLRQQAGAAFAGMAARRFMQRAILTVARDRAIKEARERAEAQRAQEIAARSIKAFFAGIVPGLLFSFQWFSSTRDWVSSICLLYLTASTIATCVGHSLAEEKRFVAALYSALSGIASGFLLCWSYGQWGRGWLAALIAVFGRSVLGAVLRTPTARKRRAAIIAGALCLAAFFLARAVLP